MIENSPQILELLNNFRNKRIEKGISIEQLEQALVLGPGWLESIENGSVSISIEMLFALLSATKIDLSELTTNVKNDHAQGVPRNIYAVETDAGIRISFRYAKFDASYDLKNATTDQFNLVIKTLRDALARLVSATDDQKEAIKTEAVASAFKQAVTLWPNANPSDLWWFLIYRAYLDPFNHPAIYSRLSFEQSWKRTGGWALEEVLVRHYGPGLKKKGINMFIAPTDKRKVLLAQATVENHRLEADKADVFLTADDPKGEIFFGIVHVKASFAERRTDDVPMSHALVNGGYISPLWTMDCKSSPGEAPINKGELGIVKSDPDRRSAKRKDIEDDSFFSACFSYNKNTKPTPKNQNSHSKVFVCDFNDAENDIFVQFIVDGLKLFKQTKAR